MNGKRAEQVTFCDGKREKQVNDLTGSDRTGTSCPRRKRRGSNVGGTGGSKLVAAGKKMGRSGSSRDDELYVAGGERAG